MLATVRDRRIAAAKLQRDTLHKNLESIYDFERTLAETQHKEKVSIGRERKDLYVDLWMYGMYVCMIVCVSIIF